MERKAWQLNHPQQSCLELVEMMYRRHILWGTFLHAELKLCLSLAQAIWQYAS